MTEKTIRTMSTVARHFFSGTLLSRFSGMVRDIAMANLFGAHPSMGAFLVAFRFSNLLRRFVAEGSLQSAFIPAYEKARLNSTAAGTAFFYDIFLSLLLIISLIILVIEGSVLLFGSGETVQLTAIMFPALLFIVLYSLNSSLLLCHGEAFTLSAAPALLNFFWIGGMVLLSHRDPQQAMMLLAVVVLIGYALQWVATLPQTFRALRPFPRISVQLFKPEIGQLWKKIFLGMMGIGATQVNSFLDTLFAHAADPAGPIYLWYAARLEQLPLALFGIACVNSFIPPFSRAMHRQDHAEAKSLLEYSMEKLFALMFCCTAAIFLLGGASINLLFCRGQFLPTDLIETTYCLWAYGIGLTPAAFTIFLASLFNAEGNFRLPSLISTAAVILNLVLNSFFVFVMGWGAVSVALSTSISALFNLALLTYFFSQRHHEWSLFPKAMGRIVAVVLLALVLTSTAFSPLDLQNLPRNLFGQIQVLVFPMTIFLFLLWGMVKYGNIKPLQRLWFGSQPPTRTRM